jgi:peptidoglycan/LPS O-acetylase OafA/YrhL
LTRPALFEIPADDKPKRVPPRQIGWFGTRRQRPKISDRLLVNNFDLLRLSLAFMVVIFHTGVLSQAPALEWMRTWMSADFGVQGFYVVSGFLVTMSYDKCSGLMSYAQKRVRRIAPAYVAVVAGAALLFVFISSLHWTSYFGDRTWWSYVFWNLLLLNFVSPDLPGVFDGNYKQAVNGSLWTIKIEVAFYCMVPAIAWLGQRVGYWRVWAGLFLASLAWRVGFELLGQFSGNFFWSKLAIQAPGQLSFFLFGTMAYERTRLGLAPPSLAMMIIAVAATVWSSGLLHEIVAPVAVGAIVYWVAIACPKLANFDRYGDLSYGIYLFHWPILQVVIALGWFAAYPKFAAVGAFTLSIAFAAFSWFALERRFLVHRRSTIAT